MVEITEITQEAKITDLVAPLDTVVSETTDKTLSSVLPSVTSSHSGVFVYDRDGKFAGLVSPHKALYSSSYPGSTSVETVLFVPPTITPDTTIYEAVSHMLATRIYSLPVFGSDEQPMSVIHADDILEHIAADSEAMKALSNRIEPNEPITANINSTAGEVHQMLKDEGISRLLLVDDTGKLEGIVTRSDLANLLVAPSMKRRFPSEGSEGGFHSRGGEKEYREDHPVRRYAVTLVNTLPAGTRANKLVSHLIESDHRSVVLVDRQQRPTGFLSVRDLLEAAAPTAVPEEVPITMSVPEEDIEQRQLRVAEKHLERFWQKMKRRADLERVAVNAKGIKNPQNQTKQFEVTVRAIPVTGEQFIASTEDWGFLDALQSATTIVEKQIRRKTLHG